jgi:hypothetical protein
VQHRAAAAFTMGIDQFLDIGLDPLLRERRNDKLALPGAIFVLVPMLDGAAAAGA